MVTNDLKIMKLETLTYVSTCLHIIINVVNTKVKKNPMVTNNLKIKKQISQKKSNFFWVVKIGKMDMYKKHLDVKY